jgi:hypothetical protein
MKILSRLLLIACLVLPFAACKKQEAPKAEKAPVAMPTNDDAAAWRNYVQDVVGRNIGDISNPPYVYLLPGESTPDFQGSYDRLLDKAKTDVARGITSGNMLAYASPASAKIGDIVVESFKDVAPGSMKGVKLLFIGKAEDNERVKAAVTPSGVTYSFVEAK